jgi:Fe-S-cluster containining protein
MIDNKTQPCTRCGRCCLANISALVSEDDMDRWKEEKREDILHIIERQNATWAGDHLISASDGHYIHGCPFLEWIESHYSCSIYTTRPLTCRNYEPGSSNLCPLFKDK